MKRVAAGDVPDTVLAEIKGREARSRRIDQELERSVVAKIHMQRYLGRISERAQGRMGDISALLRSDAPRARKALRALLIN